MSARPDPLVDWTSAANHRADARALRSVASRVAATYSRGGARCSAMSAHACVECVCCDAQMPIADACERVFMLHRAQFSCDAASAIEPVAMYVETRWPALDACGPRAHYVPRVGLAALEHVHVASAAHTDGIKDPYAMQWTRDQLFLHYETTRCDMKRANLNTMLGAHNSTDHAVRAARGEQRCFAPVPLQFVCVPDLSRDALRITVRLAPLQALIACDQDVSPAAGVSVRDVPMRLWVTVQYRRRQPESHGTY